jgi:histidinol phosphatase-like enzyme
MLHRAAKELAIDLSKSWVIGDRHGDLELAWNAGARACLVKTGYGMGEIEYWMSGWKRQPDLIAENALDAALQIVESY